VGSVLVVGLSGSWALVGAVEGEQDQHRSEVMDQRVQVIENAVAAEIGRYLDAATDLAAGVGAQTTLTGSDFNALTATLTPQRLPGVSGAALVVPATDRELGRVQRQWRALGNGRLRLDPAKSTSEHLFIVMSRPMDGAATRKGKDLGGDAAPTQALRTGRSDGQVTASATYVLPGDRLLPAAEQQLSFILAAPIYAGVGTPDAALFRGWFVMSMRGEDFLAETLQVASQDNVAATLLETSTSRSDGVPVAHNTPGPVLDNDDLRREVSVQVAGRTWRLLLQPTTQFADLTGPSLSIPAGAAGVLFTVLIAVLVGTLSTSRDRALQRVERATAALRADIGRRELVEAELRETEEQLRLMALTDSLTGLSNHRAFMDALHRAHSRSVRHGTQLDVIFGDVDHFKAINDTYGHAVGDSVLCQIASRLRTHFRAEDTIGRLGGDEFAIICEDLPPDSQVAVNRLRELLDAPYMVEDQMLVATLSLGHVSPEVGECSAHLLDRADNTMYAAKAAHHA
jgi:diguanylate cyclase (GGDEF)-like protein